MSNENNPSIPDEDGTQSLNQIVADIKSLEASVESLEIKADAQAKHTNANLLEAFAQILEQSKLDFAEIVERKVEEIVEKKVEEIVKREINNFRSEVQQEFRQMKLQLRNMDRQFHQALKYAGDASIKADDLEDRVEKLEASSPNQ
jgi:cobalamin biosynthesis protein CbiD